MKERGLWTVWAATMDRLIEPPCPLKFAINISPNPQRMERDQPRHPTTNNCNANIIPLVFMLMTHLRINDIGEFPPI